MLPYLPGKAYPSAREQQLSPVVVRPQDVYFRPAFLQTVPFQQRLLRAYVAALPQSFASLTVVSLFVLYEMLPPPVFSVFQLLCGVLPLIALQTVPGGRALQRGFGEITPADVVLRLLCAPTARKQSTNLKEGGLRPALRQHAVFARTDVLPTYAASVP